MQNEKSLIILVKKVLRRDTCKFMIYSNIFKKIIIYSKSISNYTKLLFVSVLLIQEILFFLKNFSILFQYQFKFDDSFEVIIIIIIV